MHIEEIATGERIEVEIRTFLWKSSYETTFQFDWKLESKIYALHIIKDDLQVMGLVGLEHFPDESRIHITLLEVNKENVGKSKKYERIAGCLIAFVCQLAKNSYQDFPAVSLTAKTKLIHIYREKYGFTALGSQMMFVEGQNLLDLINQYITEKK